jgi:DUF1365 family protein
MGIAPSIFFGKVMHKRLFPQVNAFAYGIYYLAFPLSKANDLPLAYNRPGFLSFYDRDHGVCDGSNLEDWARSILGDYNITKADGEIILVCMPRVMGYVFNPVSFWLCYDKAENLRAVLCEVHNTFGERHTYLCAHEDHRTISETDVIEGQKIFHVSPFLKREGHYTFRFGVHDKKFSAYIDFYDGEGKKQLVTALNGVLEPMNAASLRKAFWRYPLVTLKAIALIHWQAVKLLSKGIKYISKPIQNQKTVSASSNLTKK